MKPVFSGIKPVRRIRGKWSIGQTSGDPFWNDF